MEHRPLVKVRLYMDVLLSLRGVPGIGVPPIMRETRVRLFLYTFSRSFLGKVKRTWADEANFKDFKARKGHFKMSDETKVNVSNENGIPDPSESLTAMGMNSSVSSSCPAGAWRRFFARMLDFFVFSCILQIILVLFSLSFWLQLIILSFAIFLETVWYAKFKNTPGKYFFGCRVVDKHGSALTEKAYRTRNWAVYLQGFWCGGVASAIPFILQLPSPVIWSVVLLCAPLVIQHVMIESKGKPTTYDAPKSYSVIQISHSAAKTLIGVILFLLLSILPMISFIRFAMTGK